MEQHVCVCLHTGSKSERRKQKESEWWNRQRNGKARQPNTLKPPCKFYLNGFCKQVSCSLSSYILLIYLCVLYESMHAKH